MNFYLCFSWNYKTLFRERCRSERILPRFWSKIAGESRTTNLIRTCNKLLFHSHWFYSTDALLFHNQSSQNSQYYWLELCSKKDQRKFPFLRHYKQFFPERCFCIVTRTFSLLTFSPISLCNVAELPETATKRLLRFSYRHKNN